METKKVHFCCPKHGVLNGHVEYFNVEIGTRTLVDMSVMYCEKCDAYYTPFANFASFIRPQYKGKRVIATKGNPKKAIKREEVRVPHFISNVNTDNNEIYYVSQLDDDAKIINYKINREKRLKEKQLQKEKREQRKKNIEKLRLIYYDEMYVSNKQCVLDEYLCPLCKDKFKKETVRIAREGKVLFADVRHCESCGNDYLTPEMFKRLSCKADKKLRWQSLRTFLDPVNVCCDYREEFEAEGGFLHVPRWAYDSDKYDYYHLPPKSDDFYDMSHEEYKSVIEFYVPEEYPVEFNADLNQKSFLAEKGYSTNESEWRRRRVLEKCVKEYGKSKVLNQLNFNLNLRLKQKDGNIRYQNAINVWRSDILYVEKTF